MLTLLYSNQIINATKRNENRDVMTILYAYCPEPFIFVAVATTNNVFFLIFDDAFWTFWLLDKTHTHIEFCFYFHQTTIAWNSSCAMHKIEMEVILFFGVHSVILLAYQKIQSSKHWQRCQSADLLLFFYIENVTVFFLQ